MPLDPKRVESLFHDALERTSPVERDSYLKEACGSNLPLRKRVEALLTAFAGADEFLQQPFVPAADELATFSLQGQHTPVRLDVPDLLSARDFGDYQLLEELARGGMGVVYKARQRSLHRLVAVKVIRAGQLASPEEVQRFQSEAESAATLDHPNIVPIYEVGQQDGRHYFSMKLIEGGSLTPQLPQLRQEPRVAARLMATVARAVHHAHQRGILHRDLKPGNILVDSQGQPHVTDFGLAKRVEEDSNLTHSGFIVGTPAYMAPEQAQGHRRLNTTGDVYSLGAILYQLLTGQPPFAGSTVLQTLRQVLEQEPVRPRRLNPDAPRDLETICLKCLHKDPARRYGSAEALAEELERYLAHEPIRARQSPAWERGWMWAQRRPGIAALSALLLAVAVLGFGLVFWQWQRAEDANQRLLQTAEELTETATREIQARQAEATANQEAHARLEEARTHLYFSHVNMAHAEWLANRRVSGVEALLDRCPSDQLGWEWHYLQRLCHRDLLRLSGPRGDCYAMAYHPTGRYLATSAGDQTVRIWDTVTGKQIHALSGHSAAICSLAFSPDGNQLASASWDQTVRLWEVRSGKHLGTFRGHRGKVWSVGVSPDGRRLASASDDRTVKLWDVQSGQEVMSLLCQERVWSVAFCPDGQQLAAAAGKVVQVFDLNTQQQRLALTGHTHWVWSVAFSPNGQRLASGSWDHSVKIWDVKGKLLQTCHGHTNRVFAVAFSPDGRRLASAGDTSVQLWDVQTGQREEIVRGFRTWVYQTAFSPDGNRLATFEGYCLARIWDVRAPQDARASKRHDQPVTGLAVSSDSRLVASASGKTLLVWEAATGEERDRREHTREVQRLAFSPVGQLLAWADGKGDIGVWDLAASASQEFLLRPEGQRGPIHSLAFDRSGQRLASGGEDQTIRVWDAADGKHLLCLRGHTRAVHALAFHPDGQHLTSAAGARAQAVEFKLWDLATGQELASKQLSGTSGSAVTVRRDGQQLATGGYLGLVQTWDTPSASEGESHSPVRTMSQSYTAIDRVAFSPDGRRLAGAGLDHVIRIWDPLTGEPALTLPTTGPVQEVAFSPDGRYLVAASDRTVKVYDGTPWPRNK